MNLRASRRAAALGWALLACWLKLLTARLGGPLTLDRRAAWLQSACRGVLAGMGIRYRVLGPVPRRGLVVSNHLSYLDILIFATAMPCAFVAKAEIDSWPLFGFFARAGATFFLDRSSRRSAVETASKMAIRLAGDVPVLIFPEGTSTDGSAVLPFHPTLFQPALDAGAPVTAAAVRYSPGSKASQAGVSERELCWYGDEALVPHLLRVLGTDQFEAIVEFAAPASYPDRRTAAQATHAQVVAMRRNADISPEDRSGA